MMLRTAHKSFKPGHYPYSRDSHDLGGFFLEAGYMILINLIITIFTLSHLILMIRWILSNDAYKSNKYHHYPYSLDSHDLGGFFLEA